MERDGCKNLNKEPSHEDVVMLVNSTHQRAHNGGHIIMGTNGVHELLSSIHHLLD